MSYPHRPAVPARFAVAEDATPSKDIAPTWTVRRKAPPQPAPLPMRRYEIAYINARGDEQDIVLKAPAVPAIEEAFGAFARGTLIPTSLGPVAVEDLRPGMMIETAEGRHAPLLWIGSMAVLPAAQPGTGATGRLFRVAADSFGIGRPAPDLLLGPHARYLMKSDALKSYLGTEQALAPVASLSDGMNVIEVTPMSAVQTFHIALERHALIRANGVELETFHPGANSATRLHGDLRAQFLQLFPHIREMADFGAMCHSRLSQGDLEHLDAA